MAAKKALSAAPLRGYLVVYHSAAVIEFDALSEKRTRRAVLNIVDILRQVGPKVTEPHMKRLSGEAKLCELRPGGGKVLARPLYFRHDERTFVILSIAPESQVDPGGFAAAVRRAKERAESDYRAAV